MIAKITLLCAAFTVACANPILTTAILNTGVSTSARQQDGLGNYAFNYGIIDGLGATNSRAEIGDAAGNKKGAYTLTDIDGRARRVDYVADSLGFRASVNTNEPGTALSAPASAAVISPYAAPVAPAVPAPVVTAPVTAVAAAPAVPSPALAPVPLLAAAPALTATPLLAAAPHTISSYSTIIGHGTALGLPLGAGLLAPGISKALIL